VVGVAWVATVETNCQRRFRLVRPLSLVLTRAPASTAPFVLFYWPPSVCTVSPLGVTRICFLLWFASYCVSTYDCSTSLHVFVSL